MEVLVEISTAPPAGHTAAAEAAAAADASADTEVKWTPRAVAHFVMVLARPQQQQPQPQQQQQQQQKQPQQQQQAPAWGVPVVLPSTPLEQQHFDTGRICCTSVSVCWGGGSNTVNQCRLWRKGQVDLAGQQGFHLRHCIRLQSQQG